MTEQTVIIFKYRLTSSTCASKRAVVSRSAALPASYCCMMPANGPRLSVVFFMTRPSTFHHGQIFKSEERSRDKLRRGRCCSIQEALVKDRSLPYLGSVLVAERSRVCGMRLPEGFLERHRRLRELASQPLLQNIQRLLMLHFAHHLAITVARKVCRGDGGK